MKQFDSQDLIIKAGDGHADAQRQLFANYFPYVMSITLRYMSSREEAEEMLNDSFLKIFGGLPSYDADFPFKGWIRRITINTCIDRLRQTRKRPSLVELGPNTELSTEAEPFEIDENIQILPMLQALPARYRAVFNLYVFEEYKHKEIAKLLGISEGTSKSNYARAKSILKKSLVKKTEVNRRGKIEWAIKSLLF